MKKAVMCYLVISSFLSSLEAKKSYVIRKSVLPEGHRITLCNETDHKIVIVTSNNFKQLKPQEAVVLGWIKPLSSNKARVIKIYYGGTMQENNPHIRPPKKKRNKRRPAEPLLIAQLTTQTPGTISLFYDENGVFNMRRRVSLGC